MQSNIQMTLPQIKEYINSEKNKDKEFILQVYLEEDTLITKEGGHD